VLNNVVLSTNLSYFLEIYIHFSAWFSRFVRLVLEFHLSSTLVPRWEREERNGRREVGERNFCSASFWPQKPPTLVSTVCLGARSLFMVVIGTKIIGLFWLIKMNFEVENVIRRF